MATGKRAVGTLALLIAAVCSTGQSSAEGSPDARSFTIVDTGQTRCYGSTQEIAAPAAGRAFYGQDAQYAGNAPGYRDNGDGTVTDLNTGLTWAATLTGGCRRSRSCTR